MKRVTRLLLTGVCLISSTMNCLAVDYHVSSSSGNDQNPGTSDAPFATMARISRLTIEAGDRILFKSGETFEGMLELRAQGDPGTPIVISRYGEGPYPLLDGKGKEATIRLHNAANMTISELKITNWEGLFGIYFTGEDAGAMSNLIFTDLNIFRVGYESTTTTNPSKSIGGLCGRVFKGKVPSWWDGLTIRNVYVHDVGSCGITLGGNVNLYKTDREDPYFKPHKNVLIERCRIDSIVRDGIWIRQCENALIQYCEVSRTGMNAISNGIWFWDCIASVMQYNEGWECGSPRGNDGAPFSIDNHCLDCIIQYNYSHDNEGPGYMVFGREGDAYRNIVRNNLSYNDNTSRTYKLGTSCITICSEAKEVLVEDNIVIAGAETHHMLGHRNWEGYPHSVSYRGNLFIGNGKAGITEPEAVVQAGKFEGNLFINVPQLPEEMKDQEDPAVYFRMMQQLEEIRERINHP